MRVGRNQVGQALYRSVEQFGGPDCPDSERQQCPVGARKRQTYSQRQNYYGCNRVKPQMRFLAQGAAHSVPGITERGSLAPNALTQGKGKTHGASWGRASAPPPVGRLPRAYTISSGFTHSANCAAVR